MTNVSMSLDRIRAVRLRHPEEPMTPRQRLRLLATALAVLVAGILVGVPAELPGLRQVAVLVLLGLPVLVGVRRGRLATDPVRSFVLSVGLTVLGLLVLGLLVNTVLPWFGYDRPLSRPAMTIVVVLVDLGLLTYRSGVPLATGMELRRLGGAVLRLRLAPAPTLAVLSVLVAVTGAIRLNNGGSSWVAISGHVLVVITFGVLLFSERSHVQDSVVIYLAALALLLSMSLRGWFIIGHDIQIETIAYQLTQAKDHWVMGAFPNPYNACLSINILPTVLSNLTDIPGLWIFKVVLQALFALTPVVVLAISRVFVARRLAVISVIFFVTFPTFFNDMPWLNRQEVAFFFLSLTLMVGLHRDIGIWRRRSISTLCGLGVVFAHYSTTYVMLMTLSVAVACDWAGRLFMRRREQRLSARSRHRIIPMSPLRARAVASPLTVAVLTVATVLWVGPVTGTGGHLVETATATVRTLITGKSEAGSSDLSYSLFSKTSITPQQRLQKYVDDVAAQRAKESVASSQIRWVVAQPTAEDLRPRVVESQSLPLTLLGEPLAAAGLDLGTFNGILRLLCAGVLQICLLLGVAVLFVRWWRQRGPTVGGMDGPAPSTEALALAVGSLVGAGLIVVIPSLSVDYGVLRAFQQALIGAAPAVAVGATFALTWLRRWTDPVVTAASLGIPLVLTGVVFSVTGGYPGILSLSNSGQYYDLYYRQEPEVRAAQWIGPASQAQPRPATVATETLISLVRDTGGAIPISDKFHPLQIERGQWVFLNRQLVVDRSATVFYTGDLLTYRYPVDQLRSLMDVVYSAPSAEVLR